MRLLNFLGRIFGGTVRVRWRVTRRKFPESPDALPRTPTELLAQDVAMQVFADMTPKPQWSQVKDQIAALQQADPEFSTAAFLSQATSVYLAALTATDQSSPALLGARATQAFINQQSASLRMLQRSGLVRRASDVMLDAPVIFKISMDGVLQRITVRFTGQAVRYTADSSNSVVTEGSKQPAYFIGFATFVRPAGTTTPKAIGDRGPLHCPACGAPAQPDTAVCSFCGTPYTGPGTNWQIDSVSDSRTVDGSSFHTLKIGLE